MKRLFSFTFILAMLTQIAFAKDFHLVKIISEPENNKIHNFLLDLDKNYDIESIVRTTTNERQVIKLDLLAGKDYTLLKSDGRDVIILQCHNCDSVHGGDLGIKYLRNGLSMKYKVLNLNLQREGDEWALKHEGTKVHTLTIKPRKVLGQLVGIRKILINK